MSLKGLYVIINRQGQKSEFLIHLCEQALQGGADLIQFRDKNPISQETIYIAEELSTLCRYHQVPFVINDHIELAKRISADGIHIGQEDTGIKAAREIIGNDIFIGVTVANIPQAQQAALDGADYLGCGHIYSTITKKKTTPPIGILGLQQVVKSVSIPVFAIGGITAKRVPLIMKTGVAGIVVVSAIEKHPDPVQACQEIKLIGNRYAARRAKTV